MKRPVRIELIHKGAAEEFSHTVEGTFFEVAPLGYLRYSEMDSQLGGTMTTIRLLPDELRIQRKGAIESLFVLKPGERTSATYQMGGSRLFLSAYTTKLDFSWHQGAGTVNCKYELWQEQEKIESIDLKLIVSII